MDKSIYIYIIIYSIESECKLTMDIIICHKYSIFKDIDVNCESFLEKLRDSSLILVLCNHEKANTVS